MAAGPQRSSGPVGRHASGGLVGLGDGVGRIFKDRDMGICVGVGDGPGDGLRALAVEGDGEQFAVHRHRPVARGVAIGFAVFFDCDLHQKL